MEKSDAPQGQDQTAKKTDQSQDSGVLSNRLSPVGQDPPPPDEHDKSGDHPNPTPWRNRLNWTLIIELAVFIVAVYVACIYSHQLDQMIESNKINRETLTSVQRAFVFLGEPTVIRAPQDKSFSFYVRFPWENSGTTPTKTLTTHTSWQAQPNPITRDFSFPDIWSEGVPRIDAETLIGPHANTGNNVGPIPAPYIVAVQQHKTHLYFWGHAKYRDTFENTAEHITRFCVELVGFYGDPLTNPTNQTSVMPIFNDCGFYSCADSECKD